MNGLPPPPLSFLVLGVECSTFGVDKGGWQPVHAYHFERSRCAKHTHVLGKDLFGTKRDLF
jgi:hypothetical protein